MTSTKRRKQTHAAANKVDQILKNSFYITYSVYSVRNRKFKYLFFERNLVNTNISEALFSIAELVDNTKFFTE